MLLVRSNMVISEPNQNKPEFNNKETRISSLSVMWLFIFLREKSLCALNQTRVAWKRSNVIGYI